MATWSAVRRVYPSDVLIVNNRIYNRRARDTGNPVTAIDVVGGDRWTLRGNYIADIGGVSPSKVSYQAFLKGNGSGGLIERNLVVCSQAAHERRAARACPWAAAPPAPGCASRAAAPPSIAAGRSATTWS